MVEHSPLGRETAYVSQYDPGLLFPIARQETRSQLGLTQDALPFYGADLWTGYEVSWLDELGKPQVALAQFRIPCDSGYLVESKSFKLYLNSFNQTVFSDASEVQTRLITDLSRAAGGLIALSLEPLSRAQLPIQEPQGECLDDLPVVIDQYHPFPDYLSVGSEVVEQTLYSHLLKSNCPVTGQPDWATLQIAYRGPEIDREGLLRYIVSFREHQDFHENCVERMFVDVMDRCAPEYLSVYARYTRRGGLDINPFRSTRDGDVPPFARLIRQ